MTLNYSTEDTIKSIKELSEKALSQDLKNALIKLPNHFSLELSYKEHKNAVRASYFPGAKRLGDCTISFESESYFDILQTIMWLG